MRKVLMFILFIIFIISAGMMGLQVYDETVMLSASSRARDTLTGVYHEDIPQAMDFDAIRAAFGNDDIMAHLLIEGTTIDYLVVQGRDNEFYLNHDIWRNPTAAGWIFLDYEANIEGRDQNWVIYGHNMQRDHKFHSLRRYRNYGFLQDHAIIILTTPMGVYYWEVFSFYSTNIEFGYNSANFGNRDAWENMLEQFVQMSIHYTGVSVTADDRILTLSTCTNVDLDERFVLHARLINRY